VDLVFVAMTRAAPNHVLGNISETSRTEYGGTGLGLSISKRLVNLMPMSVASSTQLLVLLVEGVMGFPDGIKLSSKCLSPTPVNTAGRNLQVKVEVAASLAETFKAKFA